MSRSGAGGGPRVRSAAYLACCHGVEPSRPNRGIDTMARSCGVRRCQSGPSHAGPPSEPDDEGSEQPTVQAIILAAAATRHGQNAFAGSQSPASGMDTAGHCKGWLPAAPDWRLAIDGVADGRFARQGSGRWTHVRGRTEPRRLPALRVRPPLNRARGVPGRGDERRLEADLRRMSRTRRGMLRLEVRACPTCRQVDLRVPVDGHE